MLSTARGPRGTLPLEIYIKKIHSVFDMHRVEVGEPENLPTFLKRLREDRHFAMDFWALAAAIGTSEGGELPNEQMLEIIVRGVTGKDPTEVVESGNNEMKQTLDDLARLLSGVDLDSPPPTEEDTWPVTEDHTRTHSRATQAARAPITASSRSLYSQIKAVPPIEKPAEPVFDEPVAAEHTIDTAPTEKQSDNVALASRIEGDLRDDLPSSASPTPSQQALDDMLSRLEMNSRTLRLHLEDIDSRMSRIEPHLEDLAFKKAESPRDTTGPHANGGSNNGGSAKDVISDSIAHRAPESYQTARSNRTSPKSSPRLVLLTDDDDDPSIRVPLSGYERGSRSRTLPLFLAFLLVLGGLFAVQQRYGAQLWGQYGLQLQQLSHQTYDALARKLHSLSSSNKEETVASSDDRGSDPMSSTTSPSGESLHATPAGNSAPTAAAPSGPVPEAGDSETASDTPPPPSPAPAASPAPASAAPSAPVPAAPAPSAATPAPPPSATPPLAAATTATPHEALVARSRNEPRQVRGRREREPVDSGDFTRASGRYDPAEIPVNVPPTVMQENLITSRVPAYPQAAKAEGVEGSVVMQAIISKYGSVDQLHIIQGDPLLRAAASQAVARWHYRPYTVNGRPVDVSTIVKVEFKLPRQYAR